MNYHFPNKSPNSIQDHCLAMGKSNNLKLSLNTNQFPVKINNNNVNLKVLKQNSNSINLKNQKDVINDDQNFDINDSFQRINMEKIQSDKPLRINNNPSLAEILFHKPPPANFYKKKSLSQSCTKFELNKINNKFDDEYSEENKQNNYQQINHYDNENSNIICYLQNDFKPMSNREYSGIRGDNKQINIFTFNNNNNHDDEEENINFISSKKSSKSQKFETEIKKDFGDINMDKFLSEGYKNLEINNYNYNREEKNKHEDIDKERKFIKKISLELQKNNLDYLSANDINDKDNFAGKFSEADLEREVNKVKNEVSFVNILLNHI